MRVTDLHPVYGDYARFLEQNLTKPSLWHTETFNWCRLAHSEMASGDAALQVAHALTRLRMIFMAGLENSEPFRKRVKSVSSDRAFWGNLSAPPVPEGLQKNLADMLYNVDPSKGDVAVLSLGDGARLMGPYLARKCLDNKVPVFLHFEDEAFRNRVLNSAPIAKARAIMADFSSLLADTNKRMIALPGTPPVKAPKLEKARKLSNGESLKDYWNRVSSGDVFYTLTKIPTEKDAEIDGIEYGDYLKLFFEMCDQPWEAIGKAQEKLIAELNAAKILRITNSDGTDVSMDIEGFTFCNSLVAKNVPGSEVFSAPRADSVQGTIIANGRFKLSGNNIVEDLGLYFQDGYLIGFTAAKGAEHFSTVIGTDKGARFVGEIGIGTNPHLKRHVCNTLLVEKIGGSFHIALGGAYTYKEYGGLPVNVDNGNRSDIHWDLTTMLHGKQGRIYLDGRMIMDDGMFLDPAYDVLNRGWAAIPREQRPDFWKDRFKEGNLKEGASSVAPQP